MFPTLLLLAALAASDKPTNTNQLGLCARIGVLQRSEGSALAFGRRQTAKLWSIRRDVRFQVCSADGAPVAGRREIRVQVETAAGHDAVAVLNDPGVFTDEMGRFTGMYTAASRHAGEPFPEGAVTIERHRFYLDGKVVAVFVLTRSAADVRFERE